MLTIRVSPKPDMWDQTFHRSDRALASRVCVNRFPRMVTAMSVYSTECSMYRESDCSARDALWNRRGAFSTMRLRMSLYVSPFGALPDRRLPTAMVRVVKVPLGVYTRSVMFCASALRPSRRYEHACEL